MFKKNNPKASQGTQWSENQLFRFIKPRPLAGSPVPRSALSFLRNIWKLCPQGLYARFPSLPPGHHGSHRWHIPLISGCQRPCLLAQDIGPAENRLRRCFFWLAVIWEVNLCPLLCPSRIPFPFIDQAFTLTGFWSLWIPEFSRKFKVRFLGIFFFFF